MQEPTIGIKIANGSYFPILEEKSVGKKRLVLTTVKDRQESVKIDLYKSDQETLENAMYIGSLILENIQTGGKGEPEIELILGIDDEGNLTANGGDLGSGERQSLSVSLDTLSEESEFEIPDFDLDASIEPSSEISSLEEEDFSLEDFAEEEEEAPEEGAFEEAEEEAPEEGAFEEEAFGEGEFEEEALEEGPFEEESFEEETLEETGFGEVEEEFDLGDEFGEEEPSGEDTFITEEGIEEEFEEEPFTVASEEEFEEADFADEGFSEEPFEEEPFEEESFGEEPFEEEPVEATAEEPEEEEEERRVRPALIAVFVFLGVVIIGLLAFLLYRSFQGEETPPLEARGETPRTEQPAETETGGAAGAGEGETAGDTTGAGEAEASGEEPGDEAAAGEEAGAPAGEAAEEEGPEPAPGTEDTGTLGGVWYWVKWGDTLWDLSYSFYRTPWLYGMIAKVNNIKNPDLIYANSKLYIPEK